MDRDPIRTAVRKARRQRVLGAKPTCALCGEDRPEALEKHHAVGRAHDRDFVVTLCRNCHAVATESQIRAGVPFLPQETPLETLLAALRSLAAFDRDRADAVDRLLERLEGALE